LFVSDIGLFHQSSFQVEQEQLINFIVAATGAEKKHLMIGIGIQPDPVFLTGNLFLNQNSIIRIRSYWYGTTDSR